MKNSLKDHFNTQF